MNVGIIVASGSGTRMGVTECPKQFLLVGNKPMLIHTIEKFENNLNIDVIVLVTNVEYIDRVRMWCDQYDIKKVKLIIPGGATRQESVYNGIKSLKEFGVDNDDIILIHDAVRPLVSNEIIDRNIEACKKYGAVLTAVPTADTIARSKDGFTLNDIQKRSELFQEQTPQTFTYPIIRKAYEYAFAHNDTDTTDDCKLVLKRGTTVRIVQGDRLNFKVTTQEDLKILKALVEYEGN